MVMCMCGCMHDCVCDDARGGGGEMGGLCSFLCTCVCLLPVCPTGGGDNRLSLRNPRGADHPESTERGIESNRE